MTNVSLPQLFTENRNGILFASSDLLIVMYFVEEHNLGLLPELHELNEINTNRGIILFKSHR